MEGKGVAALIEERPVDPDVKAVLAMMNDLLGSLPKDVLGRFAKSKDFEKYHTVLERYGVG